MARWLYLAMHTGFQWRMAISDTRALTAPITLVSVLRHI